MQEKEESGPGDGKQKESELVANDDNKDNQSADEKDGKKDKNTEEEKEKQPHNLDDMDQVISCNILQVCL